jgi:hypothetical protein
MEKDPREDELSGINTRLKSVMQLMKKGHMVSLLDQDIARAHQGIGDDTDVFIFHDSSSFKGSRHLQSLLQIERALETKVLFAGKENIHKECAQLLERKILLMKELHSI